MNMNFKLGTQIHIEIVINYYKSKKRGIKLLDFTYLKSSDGRRTLYFIYLTLS